MLCGITFQWVHLQVQQVFNRIVTRLGEPISDPEVDLAKLRPRQQWLLWFYFKTKNCRLRHICSEDEYNQISRSEGVATSVERRSLCPTDYFQELVENVDIAMDVKNGSNGGPSLGDFQEQDHDPSGASDAISQPGDDDDDDVDLACLFGDEADEADE